MELFNLNKYPKQIAYSWTSIMSALKRYVPKTYREQGKHTVIMKYLR